jgi:hypothetical protein
MIFMLELVISNGSNFHRNIGILHQGKGDGCHEGLVLGVGEIQVKCSFGIQDFKFFWRN